MGSMKIFENLKIWNIRLASLNDEELMDKVKSNADETCYRILYENHKSSLYSFIKSLVKKEQLAEEIIHEAFYKVWNKANTYKSGARFKSWLWVIARNTAYDYLRKKSELSLESYESWEEQFASEEAGPLENILKKCEATKVKKAVEKLSVEQRDTILLWSEGFSNREMSSLQEVSEQVIKNRIFRAKKKLTELLKEEGENE
jgi:RNA polymerase sigma-70 factor (ECF subfamily)